MKQLKQFKRAGILPRGLVINYILSVHLGYYTDQYNNTYSTCEAYIGSTLVYSRALTYGSTDSRFHDMTLALNLPRYESAMIDLGVFPVVRVYKGKHKQLKQVKDFSL